MLKALLQITAKGISVAVNKHPNGNLILELATIAYGEVQKHVCQISPQMVENVQGHTPDEMLGIVALQATAALEQFINEKYLAKNN
jgi:hypothetical protein